MKTRPVRGLILSFLLVLLCLFLNCCKGNQGDFAPEGQTDESAYVTVYLIDSFSRANTEADEKYVKVEDVSILSESRRCLLERPAESPGKAQEVVFRGIRAVEGEKLEFGIGIREEAYTATADGSHLGGVVFSVLVDNGEKREPVFERTLRPFEKKEDQGWHDFSVDLSPYAGKKVDLVFATRFAEGSWVWGHSLWSEPVLIAPRSEISEEKNEVSINDILSHKNIPLLDVFTRDNTTGGEELVNITNVTIEGDSRRCLFEHPIGTSGKDQEVIFRDVELNDTARLEFGIGIREQAYTADIDGKHLGGVVFLVFIDDGKAKEPVFEHTLRPFENVEDRGWHDFSVDLSRYAGKKVNIVFVTRFAEGNWIWAHALWSGPTVINSPLGDDCPNIILISIDTLRADHLGCYGYDRDTSPNIDAFARDCMLYKYSFSHCPVTLESHSSIMTSLNPDKHLSFEVKLDDRFITLAELLSRLGYYTVSYNGGGFLAKSLGLGQGFDEYYSAPRACEADDIYWEFTGAVNALKKLETDRPKEKFFLFLHTYQVHSNYDPPSLYRDLFVGKSNRSLVGIPYLVQIGDIARYKKEYAEKHGDENFPDKEKVCFMNLYDADIRYTDAWMGRFFDFLKEEGLYDDSLIILLADHGEQFYEHQGWVHGTVYGHDLYVPLLIKYPGTKKKGIESERIARSIDVMPTILSDFLNIAITDAHFDGIPLSQPLGDEVTIGTTANYGAEYGTEDLVSMSVLKDNYKFIYFFRTDEYEVYEFRKDMLNMKKLDVDDSVINEFVQIVSDEYKIFQEKMKERLSDAEGVSIIDEETKERLKDLGYLQ